jgi:hypothetical protein
MYHYYIILAKIGLSFYAYRSRYYLNSFKILKFSKYYKKIRTIINCKFHVPLFSTNTFFL